MRKNLLVRGALILLLVPILWAIFPNEVHADDLSAKFTQFTNNLEEGRFSHETSPSIIAGKASTPAVVPAAAAAGIGFSVVAGACAIATGTNLAMGSFVDCVAGVAAEGGAIVGEIVGSAIGAFRDAFDRALDGKGTKPADPQLAVLFQSFEVNGEDILHKLIDRATLPEEVVFERHLPHFLGGATFIGSRAFRGEVLNSEGNVVPGTDVRFGVFLKDNGTNLFAPIMFFRHTADILQVATVKWDLEPTFTEGVFMATAVRLFAFDPS